MSVNVEEIKVHSDVRGFVFEPIAEGYLGAQRNAHIVISHPEAIRGNHYHINGTETIIVMGPALVRFKEAGKIRDVNVPSRKAFRFIIPPMISHAIKNTASQPNILAAFNTVAHDPANPDVVEDILI
jgi:UDP-2-acetamido-2,6-beta-L-arabino-hexul-4-ose reductase